MPPPHVWQCCWWCVRIFPSSLIDDCLHLDFCAQYGGDSHADWAGTQSLDGRPVLGEFDVGSVTSPSVESDAYIPMDLMNAAMVAGRSLWTAFVPAAMTADSQQVLLIVQDGARYLQQSCIATCCISSVLVAPPFNASSC